jgi:hypothetical protein
MIDVSVKIDTSAVQKVLDAVADRRLARKMAEAVADEDVLPALRKYPPASGRKQQWVSERQRRFVMASIAQGSIQVPYHRSGRTGASYVKQGISDGITVISGLASAEYTRGPDQAAYFKGNWDTHEDIALALEADATLTATGVIVDTIDNA